jgi:hypothetical protein
MKAFVMHAVSTFDLLPTMSHAQEISFSLLSLPTELRVEIYRHVLSAPKGNLWLSLLFISHFVNIEVASILQEATLHTVLGPVELLQLCALRGHKQRPASECHRTPIERHLSNFSKQVRDSVPFIWTTPLSIDSPLATAKLRRRSDDTTGSVPSPNE